MIRAADSGAADGFIKVNLHRKWVLNECILPGNLLGLEFGLAAGVAKAVLDCRGDGEPSHACAHLQWHDPLIGNHGLFGRQQIAQGCAVEPRASLLHEHGGIAVFNGGVIVIACVFLCPHNALEGLAIERERDSGEHRGWWHGKGVSHLELLLAGISVAVLNTHVGHQARDAPL